MAYPVVPAPYGLKPVSLIGGQPFAGQIRQYPIPYNYATTIYNGDFVSLTKGMIQRDSVTANAGNTVGIFTGCSYTDPNTKQRTFRQYYPANTAAGDIVAYVVDDPDAIFKAVVVPSGWTQGSALASAAFAVIGQNMQMVNATPASILFGDSLNGVVAFSGAGAPATTSTFPVRVMDLVRETAVTLGTANYSSGDTTSSITLQSNVTFSVPVGTEVGFLDGNGFYVSTQAYVATAITASTTTALALNVAMPATASNVLTALGAGTPLIFTQYPEVYVKINFGQHYYYAATGVN